MLGTAVLGCVSIPRWPREGRAVMDARTAIRHGVLAAAHRRRRRTHLRRARRPHPSARTGCATPICSRRCTIRSCGQRAGRQDTRNTQPRPSAVSLQPRQTMTTLPSTCSRRNALATKTREQYGHGRHFSPLNDRCPDACTIASRFSSRSRRVGGGSGGVEATTPRRARWASDSESLMTGISPLLCCDGWTREDARRRPRRIGETDARLPESVGTITPRQLFRMRTYRV